MASYKGASPENAYLLAAALHSAVHAWQEQLRHALSGSIDAICITPSTRGVPLRQQRLAGAVQLIERFLPPVEPLLEATMGRAKPRNRVDAELFQGDPQQIAGKRILLIEDTWVSGAAAVSAAVALRNAGANEVLILAIARRVEVEGAKTLHATGYQEALNDKPWRAASLPWPR
jgi:orotate phosphoribosyltransferase